MAEIGHNGGPSLEPGAGFRKLAWSKARKALLPALPLEVVRIRVKRAERLGLPYKTYATIRATSGRDIVAFLFSGNALELRPGHAACPAPVLARLQGLDGAAGRLAAIYAPTHPRAVLTANPGAVDAVARAPGFADNWSATRARLRGFLRDEGVPLDGVVLVSATAVERAWCGAAGLAGLVPAEAFFGTAS
jgi:hypothetical protein